MTIFNDTGELTIQDFLAADLEHVRTEMQAATAAVLLLDDSRQYLTARAAKGLEAEVRQGSRVPVGLGFAGRIAAERRPVVIDRIDHTTVVNPILWRQGIATLAGVPLIFEGRLIGVIHVGRLSGERFNAADVEHLEELALAVARRLTLWRGQVDRAAASALQEGLTPRLPKLAGLDLAARYVPSSQYGVGGDWYDVFPLPDGRVGFAIGDVMGHGLNAATVMGRVRSALRAYAIEDDDPASVLTRLDRKVLHFEFDQLVTAVYGIVDPKTGTTTLSSAGHLPPILVPAIGPPVASPVYIDRPLGVSHEAARRSITTRIDDGGMVFLFTDGLIERRDADIDAAMPRLLDVLSGVANIWAEIACADVMSALLTDDNDNDDDVTLLAIRRVVEKAAQSRR